MPFLSTIATYINDALQAGTLSAIAPAKYLGITTVLARKKSATAPLELLPAVMSLDGEYTLVEPNDKFALIIYHKVISNVYSNVKSSYGNSYDTKCNTEMVMVFFSDSKATQLTVEELEQRIITGFPQRYESGVFKSCLITPFSSDMDKIRVFRQEYPQSEYFLKPTNQLFLVRYRIEAVFNRDCLSG